MAVAVAKPAAVTVEIGYAFRHVTVVDVISGRLRPDMTVVVIGDRIVSVGRSQDIRVPPGVLIHDLPGKFLLPGLCDLHVQTGADVIDLPLHVANGVTTIRDMSTETRHFEMRRRVKAGTLLGPRWVLGSRIIDGIPYLCGTRISPTSSRSPVTRTPGPRSARPRPKAPSSSRSTPASRRFR